MLALQAIFDHELTVVGFELLSRSPAPGTPSWAGGAQATSRLLIDGLPEARTQAALGGRPAFVNVDRALLLDVDALPLDPGKVVLEILEGQEIDDVFLLRLRRLKAEGFRLALDDFEYEPRLEPLVRLADIVKVEVLDRDRDELEAAVAPLLDRPLQLLAEKVETAEQFAICRALGFDLFQGYFFMRPQMIEGAELPTARLEALRGLAELQRCREREDLESLIAADLGLSHRLLRYVGSAYFSLPRAVSSVHDAVTLLGANPVRHWATLVLLSAQADAPEHLLRVATARAAACRALSETVSEPDGDRLYTVGLFSVADALLAAPMAQVLGELPFDDALVAAILRREGDAGRALDLVESYEQGEFADLEQAGMLDPVARAYLGALGLPITG